MYLFNSIAPVFLVIGVGWVLRRSGLIAEAFIAPANRLVFSVGVPCLVFRAVARAEFGLNFNGASILLVLGAVALVYGLLWLASGWAGLAPGTRGTFLQAAIHGNISYIGLAMVLYSLGERGLERAAVLSGFLIVVQNSLSFLSLHRHGRRTAATRSGGNPVLGILLNPVVAGSALGLLASLWSLPIPVFLDRSLNILGSMALPTALLIMGAGLSPREMVENFPAAAAASAVKLVALPAAGWALLSLFGVPASFVAPSVLLLACPSAALTFIMAREMGGDTRLASSSLGLSTLASALTYVIWLRLLG